MRRMLIATHNKGKLEEFASLLAPLEISVISAGDLGLPEPEEPGTSFAGNAQLKARAAAKAANMPALADDSGISVAALKNGPGIFSARYAAGDYPAAFARIIAAAQQQNEWRARFTCALCLAQPDGTTATYIGHADGMIAKTPSGTQGFGYDPIFIPLEYDRSFAELGIKVKDKISHRAKAFEQFAAAFAGLKSADAV
jgi:XTP/dITP diphosphohydrolase